MQHDTLFPSPFQCILHADPPTDIAYLCRFFQKYCVPGRMVESIYQRIRRYIYRRITAGNIFRLNRQKRFRKTAWALCVFF